MKHFPPLMKDVFTHDSKCDVGSLDEHSHSEALEENMIPLAPPGADPPIIEIDFYPDWSDSIYMYSSMYSMVPWPAGKRLIHVVYI